MHEKLLLFVLVNKLQLVIVDLRWLVRFSCSSVGKKILQDRMHSCLRQYMILWSQKLIRFSFSRTYYQLTIRSASPELWWLSQWLNNWPQMIDNQQYEPGNMANDLRFGSCNISCNSHKLVWLTCIVSTLVFARGTWGEGNMPQWKAKFIRLGNK